MRGETRSAARTARGRAREGEGGATIVEFAIILPLLLLFLFGIVEFARLMSSFAGVWTAAREGARYATTVGDSTVTPGTPRYLDCAGIRQAAQAKVVMISVPDSSITIVYRNASGTIIADCNTADATYPDPPVAPIDSGATVSVTVSRSFTAIVPILKTFLNGIPLHSTQTRSIFKGIVGG